MRGSMTILSNNAPQIEAEVPAYPLARDQELNTDFPTAVRRLQIEFPLLGNRPQETS
jgi:hypothetical protein